MPSSDPDQIPALVELRRQLTQRSLAIVGDLLMGRYPHPGEGAALVTAYEAVASRLGDEIIELRKRQFGSAATSMVGALDQHPTD